MNTDTLSDVLHGIRLTGAIFFEVRACAPWVEAAAPGHLVGPRLFPGVQHLMGYHVVTEGRCWASIDGSAPLLLQAGDVILFPHGDAHVLSSSPGMTAEWKLHMYEAASLTSLPLSVNVGGTGEERAGLVCGFLGCDDRPFNPLLSTLPRVIHFADRAGSTRGWLNQFIQVALAESRDRRPGGQSVLSRISEVMFVEAVRRHLETLGPTDQGWLAGLRDEHIGRSLAVLHRRPSHPWSLEELAREAGLSRSAFADRFTYLVGRPPLQYLTRWRMQLAAGLLEHGSKVTQVAFEVGYESEAAFSRAFKKITGHTPGTWRVRNERALRLAS